VKNSFILACALSVIVSFTVQGKVVHVSEHGFIVENTITTKQTPEKVWLGLVNDVDKWWPKDHSWWGVQGRFSIEPKAGGCFCEVAAQKSAEHMHISYVEPYKLLRMTGGLGPLQGMGVYGSLDWAIAFKDNATTVTLTYSVTGINPDGFADLAPIVAKVQGMQLKALQHFVEQ
jgi:uncharacterized protein YndB with AHSA1/START domain